MFVDVKRRETNPKNQNQKKCKIIIFICECVF